MLTLCLVAIPSQILSEVWLCVNGQESEYPFNANPYARTDESGNIYDSGLKNFLKCKPGLNFANGAFWELLEFSTLRMVRIGQLGVRVS